MKKIITLAFVLSCINMGACSKSDDIKENNFVSLKDFIPSLEMDIRYHSSHNFTGRPVVGYNRPIAYLTIKAAKALEKVQSALSEQGLGLKVFDAYRPQMAVDYFERWAKDIADTIAKQEFYPDVDKRDLFTLNYIAAKSGHSRGSTVDVTLVDLNTQQELDMGSAFDLFGEQSHHGATGITPQQEKNRNILKDIMLQYGFKLYPEEWWHYTLLDETYPDTYFNFEVQ